MTDMMDVFNQFFEMVPAVSPELKDEAYKLRYQVYCVEVTGFSNPTTFLTNGNTMNMMKTPSII